MGYMAKASGAVIALVMVMCAGCTKNSGDDPATIAPVQPIHKIATSVLPEKTGGYTVLGGAPTPGQVEATYSQDTNPLNSAVVWFDTSGEDGKTPLTDQQWYAGTTRCGILWKGDSKQTPRPTQAACIAVLTDGVMSVVSGGDQKPEELAIFTEAVVATLA